MLPMSAQNDQISAPKTPLSVPTIEEKIRFECEKIFGFALRSMKA